MELCDICNRVKRSFKAPVNRYTYIYIYTIEICGNVLKASFYEFLRSSTVTGNLSSEKGSGSPQDHQIPDMLGHRRCRMIRWAEPDRSDSSRRVFDLHIDSDSLRFQIFQAKQHAFARPSSSKSHPPELDRAGVPPGPPKLLAELGSSARQSPTNGPPPRSPRIS